MGRCCMRCGKSIEGRKRFCCRPCRQAYVVNLQDRIKSGESLETVLSDIPPVTHHYWNRVISQLTKLATNQVVEYGYDPEPARPQYGPDHPNYAATMSRSMKRSGEYWVRLNKQGGECAICGYTPPINQRLLAVDHDHQTGEFRGLLCTNCNTALGLLKEDPKRIGRMLVYIQEGGVGGSI